MLRDPVTSVEKVLQIVRQPRQLAQAQVHFSNTVADAK